MTDGRGLLYVAFGATYLREAEVSAASARRHMPGVPSAVVTDQADAGEPFTLVILRPKDSWTGLVDRPALLAATPFARTVAIDTDTYFCGDASDLFELLHRVEFAFAHAPWRRTPTVGGAGTWAAFPTEFAPLGDVPECFPEANGGLLAFRSTEPVRGVLVSWERLIREDLGLPPEDRPLHDQPALRAALYRSGLRTAVVPPEYNLRVTAPAFASGPVKILHGRVPDWGAAVQRVNAFQGPRVFTPPDFGLPWPYGTSQDHADGAP